MDTMVDTGTKMKIGDLVRHTYKGPLEIYASSDLGIITLIDLESTYEDAYYHIEWHTCNSAGWWAAKDFEVLNENW